MSTIWQRFEKEQRRDTDFLGPGALHQPSRGMPKSAYLTTFQHIMAWEFSLGSMCVAWDAHRDVCQTSNLSFPRNMSEKLADMGSVNIQAWVDFSKDEIGSTPGPRGQEMPKRRSHVLKNQFHSRALRLKRLVDLNFEVVFFVVFMEWLVFVWRTWLKTERVTSNSRATWYGAGGFYYLTVAHHGSWCCFLQTCLPPPFPHWRWLWNRQPMNRWRCLDRWNMLRLKTMLLKI